MVEQSNLQTQLVTTIIFGQHWIHNYFDVIFDSLSGKGLTEEDLNC